MWNVITGNHAPARFRALATLDKRCAVATRCIKADFDGALDRNLCVCDAKLVTPKESVAIITKGVELGEGAWGTSRRAWPPPPQCLWVRLRRRGIMGVEAASVPLGEAPRAASPPQAQAFPNSTRRRPALNHTGACG